MAFLDAAYAPPHDGNILISTTGGIIDNAEGSRLALTHNLMRYVQKSQPSVHIHGM